MQRLSPNASKKNPLLSPFRYPGGKTWLRPIVRQWLHQGVTVLAEPFAGSGIVSITALNENLAKKAIIIELDPHVASVWKGMLNGKADWLCRRIRNFRPNRQNVRKELEKPVHNTRDIIWATLLRNRVSHGGLIAPGSGLLKKGDSGRGMRSRWYPRTLVKRIQRIHSFRDQISFRETNALRWLHDQQRRGRRTRIAYFIDPPYSLAGKRLYRFGSVNHSKLFEVASRLPGRVLMTYDDAAEIRKLARVFGFKYRRISMRNTHHATKKELLISKDFRWLKHKQLPQTKS